MFMWIDVRGGLKSIFKIQFKMLGKMYNKYIDTELKPAHMKAWYPVEFNVK